MRTDFQMSRGIALPPEIFATIDALARRIHQLRGFRSIHLHQCDLAKSMPPHGDCISIRLDEVQRGELIGYVFFPETRGYVWPANRDRLSEALRKIIPDDSRHLDADIVDFPIKGRAA